MSGHRNFEELRKKFSSERRAHLDEEVKEMQREYAISQIRREAGFTQVEMAERLSISQPTYAEFEKGGNMRIGTLQKIVAALGGILKFEVELDGRDYPLQMPQQYSMA